MPSPRASPKIETKGDRLEVHPHSTRRRRGWLPFHAAAQPAVAPPIRDQHGGGGRSTVIDRPLAVIGAFGLWLYQVRTKQHQLEQVYVPIFQPLYENLVMVRELSTIAGSRGLMKLITPQLAMEQPEEPLPPHLIAAFQVNTLAAQINTTCIAARNAISHWGSIQDVLVNVNPKHLKGLLEMHNIATMAIEMLPMMHARAEPQYVDQMFWEFTHEDAELLKVGLGRMAKALNDIDRGQRDESGAAFYQPAIDTVKVTLGMVPRS